MSPSEGDIAEFFGVSGPSAHLMLDTLERRGLLLRVPGVARSSRLNVPRNELPYLSGPQYHGDDPVRALVAFAVFLVRRATRRIPSLPALGRMLFVGERLVEMLLDLGAPAAVVQRAHAQFLRDAGVRFGAKRRRAETPPAVEPDAASPEEPSADEPSAAEPSAAERGKKKRRPPPPGQGNLF